MDNLSVFISKLEQELEAIPPGTLKPETYYRQIPEWSSMYALVVMALSETEYDVTITGEDLRSCQTIGELYQLIHSRKS